MVEADDNEDAPIDGGVRGFRFIGRGPVSVFGKKMSWKVVVDYEFSTKEEASPSYIFYLCRYSPKKTHQGT